MPKCLCADEARKGVNFGAVSEFIRAGNECLLEEEVTNESPRPKAFRRECVIFFLWLLYNLCFSVSGVRILPIAKNRTKQGEIT